MREVFGMWKLGWSIMILLSAAFASGQEKVATLTLPKEVTAKVNEQCWIVADTKGKVIWRIESGDRAKFERIDPTKLSSPNVLGLFPKVKGKFYIGCVTVEGGEITEAETILTVESSVPEPKPVPPPDPKPVPPSDPLAAKLQAAYDADPAPKIIRESAKGLISALYSAMADHVKDVAVISTEDLRRDLETTAKGMLPPGALVAMRKVIAAEVQGCLGTQPVPLTADMRTQAGACFTRIASAMDAVR